MVVLSAISHSIAIFTVRNSRTTAIMCFLKATACTSSTRTTSVTSAPVTTIVTIHYAIVSATTVSTCDCKPKCHCGLFVWLIREAPLSPPERFVREDVLLPSELAHDTPKLDVIQIYGGTPLSKSCSIFFSMWFYILGAVSLLYVPSIAPCPLSQLFRHLF